MPRELTPIEQLQLLIPGYRGYKAKDLIRQDDFLVRRAVADRLEQAIRIISEKESFIASADPFSPQLKVMEFLISKIRELINYIMSSQGGGADIYARWKVTTEELDQIVNHDVKMIDIASQIVDLAKDNKIGELEPLLNDLRTIFYDRMKLFYPPELRK
ncbi:hypothetical protein GFS03_04355 [Sulfolobus sp. E5-1-F]|uniref:hypothetical protein n=1 Tax=Sulfolobaceae TaxID=118883 RepID=UPI00129529C3|nr:MULTISPECIES: hypothetical protein [unclassified Sulfolobus]QGA53863.1 hypothetical protein GFS03_04355 [Sulfolobus sp. E5-1-F]QGA69081.1 hypothetical protein GFS33_10545 [Sulfolobus sp. E11-6]